jgi:hypothetical protein
MNSLAVAAGGGRQCSLEGLVYGKACDVGERMSTTV